MDVEIRIDDFRVDTFVARGASCIKDAVRIVTKGIVGDDVLDTVIVHVSFDVDGVVKIDLEN